MLVNWEMGGGAPPTWVGPRPKIFWLVNPTHGWVKPPKFRQNRRDGPSPCVSLTRGHSVNADQGSEVQIEFGLAIAL